MVEEPPEDAQGAVLFAVRCRLHAYKYAYVQTHIYIYMHTFIQTTYVRMYVNKYIQSDGHMLVLPASELL